MTVLQPPHCLLMGPSGSGKTTAIATFAKAGLDVFVLVTEPTGVDSLLDAWKMYGLPLEKLHYHVVAPASAGWGALEEMVTKIKFMSYKDLSELKGGIGKDKMDQYMNILKSIQNFKCDRDGKEYGDVTSWGPDRAFGIDSLSGLSEISLQLTVGFKPSPHQGEWGIAMSATSNLLLKLSSDCQCFFFLTAHIEKEPDEITGMAKVTVSTLGRKLAPKIPRFFSEHLRARKDSTGKFLWATIDGEADLKNRAFPSSGSLEPSFAPAVEAYRRRVAAISPAPPEPTATPGGLPHTQQP